MRRHTLLCTLFRDEFPATRHYLTRAAGSLREVGVGGEATLFLPTPVAARIFACLAAGRLGAVAFHYGLATWRPVQTRTGSPDNALRKAQDRGVLYGFAHHRSPRAGRSTCSQCVLFH